MIFWQHPASWSIFRPHASYLRKEARCRASAKKLPKGTPWKGFLWTPPETEGPRSLWHPGAARYRDFPGRALLRTFERLLVGGTTNLEDPTRRKANFLWKFLCAGGAFPTAMGTPSPPQSPRKDFCRAKMPCGGERLLDLLPGSLIVVRTANQFAIADQSESAGKNRRSAQQGRYCLTRTTGIAQGSADPCVMLRGKRNTSNFFPAARHGASFRR